MRNFTQADITLIMTLCKERKAALKKTYDLLTDHDRNLTCVFFDSPLGD